MTVNSRSFCFSRGNPVLELGCGSGDRLVAFEPSYGVDFCSTTVARAKHAILGSTSYPARSRIPPPCARLKVHSITS
jgi:cyclopropane fatty-acyl-phospholipid synthase-like methyltransferase